MSEADGPAQRLAVSGVTSLSEAYASTTDMRHWQLLGDRRRWLALADQCWESRAFGDFWMHVLVAEGPQISPPRSTSSYVTSPRSHPSSLRRVAGSPTSLATPRSAPGPPWRSTATCTTSR